MCALLADDNVEFARFLTNHIHKDAVRIEPSISKSRVRHNFVFKISLNKCFKIRELTNNITNW